MNTPSVSSYIASLPVVPNDTPFKRGSGQYACPECGYWLANHPLHRVEDTDDQLLRRMCDGTFWKT